MGFLGLTTSVYALKRSRVEVSTRCLPHMDIPPYMDFFAEMTSIAILLLVSLGAVTTCDALGANPGAIIKIRRSALDSFFGNVEQVGGKYARKLSVPDISETLSNVDLQTRGLRVTSFAKPKIAYKLRPPNKIGGSIRLPSVGVQGPFNATRRFLIMKQKDSGLLVFNASDVQVSFQATLGEGDGTGGMPMIDKFECQSSMGQAFLNIRNAREGFTIDILSVAARKFRTLYNQVVCSTAKKMVSSQMNRLLARVPHTVEVKRGLSLRYQAKPKVGDDYVQVALYGKVLSEQSSPYEPDKFVETPNEDAMVVLLISDAPFNDLCYQAFANGKLEFTINKESHPELYSLVRMQCEPGVEACLGNAIPDVVAKYGPDALVEVSFKPLNPPRIEFVKNKATFEASFGVQMSVAPANDSEAWRHEVSATAELQGALQVKIRQGVIYAKIRVERVEVRVDQEDHREYENRVQKTIKSVVEEYVNTNLLLKGLPLQLPFVAGVDDPLIKFAPHTLQAHSGFEFEALTSSEEHDG